MHASQDFHGKKNKFLFCSSWQWWHLLMTLPYALYNVHIHIFLNIFYEFTFVLNVAQFSNIWFISALIFILLFFILYFYFFFRLYLFFLNLVSSLDTGTNRKLKNCSCFTLYKPKNKSWNKIENYKKKNKKKNQNINLRVPYNRYTLSSFIFGLLFGYSNVKTSCTYIKPIFIALPGFLFLFNAKRKHILVVHTKKKHTCTTACCWKQELGLSTRFC